MGPTYADSASQPLPFELLQPMLPETSINQISIQNTQAQMKQANQVRGWGIVESKEAAEPQRPIVKPKHPIVESKQTQQNWVLANPT